MATQEPEEVTTTRGEVGWRYVGPDDRGVELEVIAVEVETGDLLVIHVMPSAFRGGRCMGKRTPPEVTVRTSLDRRDVDLQHDVRHDTDGRRVDDEYVERVAEASRKPGRPPLVAGEDGPSPSIAFRVSAALREQAEELAAREGKTVSQIAREALQARLTGS